jgi:hypothetical protein
MPARPHFLKMVHDLADPTPAKDATLDDAISALDRYVLDFRHHAKAGVLVEIGERLHDLTQHIDQQLKAYRGGEKAVGEAKIKVVDDILAKVPGFDNLDDINPDHLVDAFSLLDALAEEYEVEPSWQGYPKLRERLVDNRVKEDDASGTLDALKADRDELARELEAVKAENRALRGDLKGLLNHVGTLHGEAAKVAEARFGAKPAA